MDEFQESAGARSTGSWVFGAAVLAACLNGVAVGNLAGWPQAAIPQLLSPATRLSEAQVAWIAGVFFAGMLAGGFASLPLAGRYGKRRLFLLASLPLLLGWAVIAVAASFWQYISGRVILGLGSGLLCYPTELYLSEISPAWLRSRASIAFCACIHVGILLSFALGPRLSVSSSAGLYLAVVLTLAALHWAVAPETPFWLVRRGREEEALLALRRLRGRPDVHEELAGIVEFVERSVVDKSDGVWASCRRVLRSRANRKAILLVVLLTTAQQFSGMAALHSYAQLIFERSAITAIPGRYVSLLIGLIELGCTAFSGLLVERVGRRGLVAASSIVCSGCMAVLGFHFSGASSSGALAIVCVVAFALAYGLGLATMAAVVAAECLSMDARNLGAAAQNTTVCASIFFITKMWQTIASTYGQQYSFWTAAVVTALHTIVLSILLPETRGKSLTEIQRLLASGGGGSTTTDKSAPLLTGAELAQVVKVVPAGRRSR